MRLKNFLFLLTLTASFVVMGCDASPVTGPYPTDDQIDPNPPRSPGAPGGPAPAPAANESEEGEGQAATPPPPKKPEIDFGTTSPVYKRDNVYLAGQPGQDDFKKIADAGVTRVISVCKEGEVSWDEKAAVEAAGMAFHHIPIASPDDLTEETFEKVRQLLADGGDEPTLLHCKGAVRAEAVWIPFRAINQGKGVVGTITEMKDMASLSEDWMNPGALYATKLAKEAKASDE